MNVRASSTSSSVWITHAQAAAILGVHPSAIPKLVRKGALSSRGRGPRPSLHIDEVTALLRAREEAKTRPRVPWRRPRVRVPPDDEHEWVGAVRAATLLGVSRSRIAQLTAAGRLPFSTRAGQRWYRVDQLELIRNAREANRRRSPSRAH